MIYAMRKQKSGNTRLHSGQFVVTTGTLTHLYARWPARSHVPSLVSSTYYVLCVQFHFAAFMACLATSHLPSLVCSSCTTSFQHFDKSTEPYVMRESDVETSLASVVQPLKQEHKIYNMRESDVEISLPSVVLPLKRPVHDKPFQSS